MIQVEPSKKANHRHQVARELRSMQELAYRLVHDPETPTQSVAQLMRAYDVLEERKRVMKMKPRPKDVEVPAKSKRGGPRQSAPEVFASKAA